MNEYWSAHMKMTYSVNRTNTVLAAEEFGDERWRRRTAIHAKVDVRSFGTPEMHYEKTMQVSKTGPLSVNFNGYNLGLRERAAAVDDIA